MRVEVDTAKCVAAGQCVLAAPEIFDQREDDGTVTLLAVTPDPDLVDPVRDAEAGCPAGAIRLADA